MEADQVGRSREAVSKREESRSERSIIKAAHDDEQLVVRSDCVLGTWGWDASSAPAEGRAVCIQPPLLCFSPGLVATPHQPRQETCTLCNVAPLPSSDHAGPHQTSAFFPDITTEMQWSLVSVAASFFLSFRQFFGGAANTDLSSPWSLEGLPSNRFLYEKTHLQGINKLRKLEHSTSLHIYIYIIRHDRSTSHLPIPPFSPRGLLSLRIRSSAINDLRIITRLRL